MDPSADIASILEGMDNREMFDILSAAAKEVYGEEIILPPSPPLSPATAGLELNLQPHPLESQGADDGAFIPMGADPLMPEQQHPVMAAPTMYDGSLHQAHNMQPAQLHGQTAACSQGQFLPYQWPNVLTAPAVSHAAAAPHQQTFLPYQWPNVLTAPAVSHAAAAPPQQTVNEVPVMNLTGGQGLRCVGVLNGEMVYEVTNADFTAPVSAPSPLYTFKSKKRKRDDDRQYVKKPPNAFMLFLKEQRSTDEAKTDFKGKGTAAVNAILGQRWSAMTAEQKSKYFEQAAIEKRLHAEKYPDWSSKDNYVRNQAKIRRRAPSAAEAFSFYPEEDAQQAQQVCATLVQPAQTEAPSTSQGVMDPHNIQQVLVLEAPSMQTVRVQLPHTQTAVTVPVCDTCCLPKLQDVSSDSGLDSPAPASMLASPATPTQTLTESTNSEEAGGQVSPSDEQLSLPEQPEPRFCHLEGIGILDFDYMIDHFF